jgi:hypothetical protein
MDCPRRPRHMERDAPAVYFRERIPMNMDHPPRPRRRIAVLWAASGLLLALGVATLVVLGSRRGDDFAPVRYTDRLQPVSGVPTVPVREARESLNPAELVLGVTVGDDSRAYPVNLLNDRPGHKILNDTLGGAPIAATW